ncbi:MAG: DUF4432 family protein, partial [Bacteroidota bacterium]
IGHTSISIYDEVINRGNTKAPHMLLYHCNFGWPLVDEGTDIIWNGQWKARDAGPKIFREGNNFRKCSGPLDEHSGGGEEAAFIDIHADASGQSICGLYNERLSIGVALRFSKKQLPWLINWQHWGKGEYVTGLEPATHPPIGQAKARQENTLIQLAPGESRSYDLQFEVLYTEDAIQNFLNHKTIAD